MGARDFRSPTDMHARSVYRSPMQMVADLWRLIRNLRGIGRLMRGDSLEPAFRERLMLAVTAVNECRYCSYGHARQALQHGVTRPEIEALAGGQFDGCPREQLPALLYAQHWAETDGDPDDAARARVCELYGQERADAIELALSLIRVGNLGGNTLDHVLYRASAGRWGRDAAAGPRIHVSEPLET